MKDADGLYLKVNDKYTFSIDTYSASPYSASGVSAMI